MNPPTIDLNSDVGESFGRYTLGEDHALFEVITSANIACGWHAGDPLVMRATVRAAARKGVALGAHPGYPDLQGFGRRELRLTPEEVYSFTLYQLGAIAAFARAEGAPLRHVKAHGALYNQLAREAPLAEAFAQAVRDFDARLMVMTLPNSALERAAQAAGLRVLREGFADRAYRPDGSLVPRSEAGALLHDPAEVVRRAVRMATAGEVITSTGEAIPLPIDTLCIHGDTPGAANLARRVREALAAAGVRVAAPEAP